MAKTPTQQQARIDEIMEQASAALVGRDYFLCEKLSVQALRRAHALHDFDRMARILLPLQEARRQKRDMARDAGTVCVVNDQLPTGRKLVAGCYLVIPPRVGIDGRLLRDAADEKRVPVIVIVREPVTREGLWPIVAVGPITVRTKVSLPTVTEAKKPSSKKKAAPKEGELLEEPPPPDWFIDTCEALGDAAIGQISADAPAASRVDQLFLRLDTVRDHEKLHQHLADTCRIAQREPPPKRKPIDELMQSELDS